MYSALLTGIGSLGSEMASSIGKYENKKRQESVYTIAFLSIFSIVIFFIVSICFFEAKFVFTTSSIPFVLLRICLEIINAYVCAQALVKAERSSLSFISLGA